MARSRLAQGSVTFLRGWLRSRRAIGEHTNELVSNLPCHPSRSIKGASRCSNVRSKADTKCAQRCSKVLKVFKLELL
jgi:hypothetical protein